MSFWGKIVKKKTNEPPHGFSEIMKMRELLVVFLPEDIYESYRIISYINGWNELFKKIYLFTSESALPFFSRLLSNPNLQVLLFNTEQPAFQKAVIMNFGRQKSVLSFIKRCSQSTVIDIANQANMQFVPPPRNSLELFGRFCGFYDLQMQESNPVLSLNVSELNITKQRFTQNRFPNFLLEMDQDFSGNELDGLIRLFKQNFSANLYLSDKSAHKKDLINLEDIRPQHLADLYNLAGACDLFITSKPEVAQLFAAMGVFVLLYGTQSEQPNLHCFTSKDLFKIKSLIHERLKEIGTLQE